MATSNFLSRLDSLCQWLAERDGYGVKVGGAIIACSPLGLGLAWPEEPPEEVEMGQKFNVTYQALATEEFFSNAYIFPSLKYVEFIIILF